MALSGNTSPSARVIAACDKWWTTYQADCSGFVRAVAKELGVTLTGNADAITAAIQQAPWQTLAGGSAAAGNAANNLVIGGLAATPHGHVVVVVPGPLADGKYPTAYWGMLNGVGKKNTTINWAWNKQDRDKVIYACRAF